MSQTPDSALTRREHFARARRWGLIAGVCAGVLVASALIASASEQPLLRALAVLAFLGVGVSGISAGYRLLLGYSRPADWKPLAGPPLDRFEPDDEERALRKRIARELGERLTGDIAVERHNIADEIPADDRSRWERFVSSSEVLAPRYGFAFSIPTDRGAIALEVWYGRSEKEATAVRMRVILEARCDAAIGEPVTWPGDGASALRDDETLSGLIDGLLRKRVLAGGAWVFHPAPSLTLVPEDGAARATLDTIEQDWKGGLVVTLGLERFVGALDRIEALWRTDS